MVTQNAGRVITAVMDTAQMTVSAPGASTVAAINASATKYVKFYYLGNHLTALAGSNNKVDLRINVAAGSGFSTSTATISDISINEVTFGANAPIALRNGAAYRYGFNGYERDDELKGSGNSYDFGARIYDPRLVRWMTTDPLKGEYSNLSPYSFAANSPIIFIDEAGQYIRLAFESKKAYDSYIKIVNTSLEGQFEVKLKVRTEDRLGYNFEVYLEPTGGDVGKLTAKGKAFYDQYSKAINANEIARQKVVYDDKNTTVGSFKTNKLDVGDIVEFDKAGEGGASSAGVLIHETIEQLSKSEFGLDPGQYSKSSPISTDEADQSHTDGINAENQVNGNKRNGDVFIEKDGSKTIQNVSEDKNTGGLKVSKSR